jgi:hypothetical protein
MFFLISAISVLSYPVASQAVLYRSGLSEAYPSFITGFVWVGNLRVFLLTMINMLSGIFGPENLLIVMFPFAIWMIWASWSVATLALGRGGWVGAGMVLLALVLEMLLGVLFIIFILPPVPT